MSNSPPGAVPLIVVAEDEPSIRQLFKSVLEAVGYAVMAAADGKEAIKLLRAHAADLLMTDLIMPGQEGLETIVEVRREFPKLKILVVSGYEEYLKPALMLGAEEALLKPVSATVLVEKVRALVGEW